MSPSPLAKLAIVALSALLLAACGGGGKGSTLPGEGATPTPAPVPSPTPSASPSPLGVLSRKMHSDCVAPDLAPADPGTISLQAAFPNLPALPGLLGLYQAPGDSAHWYALLRAGSVLRFANDPAANSVETFLSLNNVRTNSEMGFLGIAFHPNFQSNGEVFVSYNDSNHAGRSTISRMSLNGATTIDPNSEEVLLTVDQPADNHNGGDIHFGPDGYLYIGFGDGGGGNDQYGNGQNTGTLLAAMLRIDVDHPQAPLAYGIPADNPFVGNAAFRPEIYAYGLRNPWRWSFDQATGNLWLADVGQGTWEEVDMVNAGDNLGWSVMEGKHCFGSSTCNQSGKKLPILEYDHSNGSCSITGGFVYRNNAIPALDGNFIYGDYCSGLIWRGYNDGSGWQSEQIADAPFNVAAFGQGEDGKVYALNLNGGAGTGIYALAQSSPQQGTVNAPQNLSETGCYSSTSTQTLADFVVPYDVQAPLWSDGARKLRGFAIPDGSDISLAADGDFEFPVGTVLIKEFFDGDTPLETRLYMHHLQGWRGYSYEWLPDGSDAVLLDAGKTADTGHFVHTFPAPGECDTCHTVAAGKSLGIEAAQLNRAYDYSAGSANQLAAIWSAGFLASDPLAANFPNLVNIDDTGASLAQRARSYLHSNCSNCHRPGSTAAFMDLRAQTALLDTGACDVVPAADLGIANAKIIAPGNAAASVLLARMRATDSTRMPPLASLVEDQNATAVIEDWINSLSGCD